MTGFVKDLTEKLSQNLGRPINDNFTNTVIRFHDLNNTNLTGFVASCKALGINDSGFVSSIFELLSKNKQRAKNSKINIQQRPDIDAEQPPEPQNKRKIPLNEHKLKPKKNKIVLAFDEEIEQELPILSKSKKPVSFKKLTKEGAMKIKQKEIETVQHMNYDNSEYDTSSQIASGTEKPRIPSPSLSELARKEKSNKGLSLLAKTKLAKIRREKDSSPSPDVDSIDKVNDTENDREWYNTDEYGHLNDDYNPFGTDESAVIQKETQLKKSYLRRQSSKAKDRQTDTEAWERHQLKLSGIGNLEEEYESDDDEIESNSIKLIIHHLVPPFLDGQTIFTKQKDPVNPVRDPQSDLAVFARKGSVVVHERRVNKERKEKAKDATNLAGTTIGKIMGIKEVEPSEEESSLNNLQETPEEAKPKLSMKQQRKTLPAYTVRNELLNIINENQVVVIIGETGSGKTTQLTQFLLEEGYGEKGMIGCTQPRRVAAMSVAKRVSEEMSVKLGNEVGFTIRFEDNTNESTLIKYMTDGILLRETLLDSNLEKYSCIIIDEAHERSLNTDVLLGLFRNILVRRKDLKLIITSATMNAERFSQFFGYAPTFTIPGRTFPVDVMFSKSSVEDYVDKAVKQVLTIHLQFDPGDILVFMTGQEDVEATCDMLKEKLEQLDNPAPLEILPMYSQLPSDLQNKIFNKMSNGVRKCVVATNIAETSLTVDGIKYVVDTGFSKMKVYNPRVGMDFLQVVPISLANANQRSGRAGRTEPGSCYRLYTEKAAFEEMYVQQIPEIQRTNLSNTLLLLKSLGINDLIKFPFLDPPPQETISSSLFELWSLGALDNLGQLTDLGRLMSQFPMDPSLSKILIKAIEFGCSQEMIIIVSMLSVPRVFQTPKERQQEADASREKFYVTDSDHLTLLNVYKQWEAAKYSELWCKRNFLNYKSLRHCRDIKQQLELKLKTSKIEIRSSGKDWDMIRKCICSGYIHQTGKIKGFGQYSNLRTGLKMELHPTSSLFGMGDLPTYVIYHELLLTSKEYMNIVTAVDPAWLLEFGNYFYGVRDYVEIPGIQINSREQLERILEEDRTRYQDLRVKENEKSQKKSSVVSNSRPIMRRRGL